jgi:hypothetical protein
LALNGRRRRCRLLGHDRERAGLGGRLIRLAGKVGIERASYHQIDVDDNWTGVGAFGTWNGYDCGFTGVAYNNSPVYYFGVGADLCTGQGFGCGAEYTTTANSMWNYYDDAYFGNGYWNSPSVNLCPG